MPIVKETGENQSLFCKKEIEIKRLKEYNGNRENYTKESVGNEYVSKDQANAY